MPRPPMDRRDAEGRLRCARCREHKASTAFRTSARNHDGFDEYCLECRRAYGRANYQLHLERERARNRAKMAERRLAAGFPPAYTNALVWWRENPRSGARERLCSDCMTYMAPECFRRCPPGRYSKGRREDDWLARVCRVCARESRRSYYAANAESEKRAAMRWQKAHPIRARIHQRNAARAGRLRRKLALLWKAS